MALKHLKTFWHVILFKIYFKICLKYFRDNFSHLWIKYGWKTFLIYVQIHPETALCQASQCVYMCVCTGHFSFEKTGLLVHHYTSHPSCTLFREWNALKESVTPPHTQRFMCEIFHWQTAITLFSVLYSRHFLCHQHSWETYRDRCCDRRRCRRRRRRRQIFRLK